MIADHAIPRTTSLKLPRIALVGDVAAAATVGGPRLLYRLFEEYPASQLLIIQGNLLDTEPDRRLPNISYDTLSYAWRRPMATRFYRIFNRLLIPGSRLVVGELMRRLASAHVEAVVSVAHGHLWLAAARAAQRLGLPFHLILHDDWAELTPCWPASRRTLQKVFRHFYAMASTRLCISPYMADRYARLYGVQGSVLYPNRGLDSPEPFVRLREDPTSRFTVAYAGALTGVGYIGELQRMARLLELLGGSLAVYSNTTSSQLNSLQNVTHHGFVTPRVLAERLADSADVLYVPMGFGHDAAVTSRVAFPSKLADYTAIGLPLLISGPPECTAVRWAHDYPGVAAVVDDPSDEAMLDTLRRLQSDRPWLWTLARRAVEVGNECFGYESARDRLWSLLAGQQQEVVG